MRGTSFHPSETPGVSRLMCHLLLLSNPTRTVSENSQAEDDGRLLLLLLNSAHNKNNNTLHVYVLNVLIYTHTHNRQTDRQTSHEWLSATNTKQPVSSLMYSEMRVERVSFLFVNFIFDVIRPYHSLYMHLLGFLWCICPFIDDSL